MDNDTEVEERLLNRLRELTAARIRSRPAFPESTYRMQFHAGFTFRDAAAIVPYLHALGVTHCYASPYLKAQARKHPRLRHHRPRHVKPRGRQR